MEKNMTMNQYSRRPVELTEADRAKILATLRGETAAADRGILEALRGETPIGGAQVLQDDAVQEARASAPRQSSVRKNVRITEVAGR